MRDIEFTKEELERYSRHLIIPEFNIEGQKKLRNARVLVIGAGGLGSPALLYLTAAGVGQIGIVDDDIVEQSNLQRQVLYNTADIGKPKVEAAIEHLSAVNSHVSLIPYHYRLTSSNALQVLGNYQVIIDGTDNFPTRYLVNDACLLLRKPYVYGSVFRFEGQVSVFNHQFEDGSTGPNYRDLFPSPPPSELVPNCAEGGVLGVLPGIIGSIQASETIKIITGVGHPLAGRVFIMDAATFETRTIQLNKNPQAEAVTKLIDYEQFCGMKSAEMTKVNAMTARELYELTKKHPDTFQLIDIRESYEREISDIGGEWIPLDTIADARHKISRDKKVIIYCRSGVRSAKAIRLLSSKFGFQNLYNLEGGLLDWVSKIDPDLPSY